MCLAATDDELEEELEVFELLEELDFSFFLLLSFSLSLFLSLSLDFSLSEPFPTLELDELSELLLDSLAISRSSLCLFMLLRIRVLFGRS